MERGLLELEKPSDDKRANLDRLRDEAGERACDGVILTSEAVTSGTCIVYSATPPAGHPMTPAEAEAPAPR
jgi:hypothetical protein